MNNWRFLLLAVLCIFQPIFSEENLFNDRERCFLQRSEFSRRDTRFLELQSSTPIPETRQVKSENRRETRNAEGHRDIENHGFRYSMRVLSNHDEGIDRTVQTSSLVRGFEYRVRHSGERINRNIQRSDAYSSRNDRRQSKIRDVRQEKTNVETRIRDTSLTLSLEDYARLSPSEKSIRENRRSLERDVIRTRDQLSRATESHLTRNRRTDNRRQLEREWTRALRNNLRLQHSTSDGLQREFMERDDLDGSRNFGRELRTTARSYNRVRSLEELDKRSNKRTHRERQNLRSESEIRSLTSVINEREGSPGSDGLRRNNINVRRSYSNYRPNSGRKLQNGFRMELGNRVRRGDIEINTRAMRDSRIRENEVDSGDFIVWAIREERTISRNNNQDSDRINRRRVIYWNSVRSQRQFGSDLRNKLTRQFQIRSNRIDNFNKNTNDRRAQGTPMKQANRIAINEIERRQSNILKRERNFENFRMVEHDYRQKENFDNNRRLINEGETREYKDRNSRQNLERDNDRRLQMIESIPVDRIRENGNIRVLRDSRFTIKNRKEDMRSYRTNDLLSTSRKSFEGVFDVGLDLQHLLYVIQVIYLFGLFMTLPRSEDAVTKQGRIGIWSTSKLMKVD